MTGSVRAAATHPSGGRLPECPCATPRRSAHSARSVALVALVGATTTVAQAAEPAADLPAGKQVAIGNGRKLFLRCAGSGSPTVVLDSGIHDSSDTWNLTDTKAPVPASPSVFLGIAQFTRVCEYDRPGTIRYTKTPAITTRSTPVDNPRTLDGQVGDLQAVLQKAHVPGPYLLVAHSYGGMIARRFTQLHPRSVAGVVFVDAFSPAIKPLFGDLWTQYEDVLNHPGLALDRDPTWETVDVDEAIAAIDSGPGAAGRPGRGPEQDGAVRHRTHRLVGGDHTPRSGVARCPAVARRPPAPDPPRAGHGERPLRPDRRSRPRRQRDEADPRPDRGRRRGREALNTDLAASEANG